MDKTDIKHIDRDELRKWLEDMELEPVVDSEGALFAVLPADDVFPHDVVFHFRNDDAGWFGIEAVADEFNLEERQLGYALALTNEFARRARLPKAFVMNGRFKVEQWTQLPAATDSNYIKEYIRLVLTMGWRFFADANEQLKQI